MELSLQEIDNVHLRVFEKISNNFVYELVVSLAENTFSTSLIRHGGSPQKCWLVKDCGQFV